MIKARIKAENSLSKIKSYAETYKNFSWDESEKEFTWHETGRMNIVYEAIDRWSEQPDMKDQKALIFEKNKEISTFTYHEIKELSCKWANLFKESGFKKGDRLFIFLPPCPEIYFAFLACCRLGVIFCPIFSSLGYDELEERIMDSKPKGILTHPYLTEKLPVDNVNVLEYIFFTKGPLPGLFSKEVLVEDLLPRMPSDLEPEWVKADTPLFLVYTSGSTGPPKGIVHAHYDMVGYMITARNILDARKNSIVWTDGDPAWITGTVYSTFAVWLCSATSIIQGSPFSASTWYRTLEINRVSIWYTTPLTIMKLMEAGDDLPSRYDLSSIIHIATVGHTLLPDMLYWAKTNLKHSLHDTWWMSETGMICIANFASMDIKPGSMGKPVPGIEAAILDENGEKQPFLTMGELALKAPWPTMMRSIWHDENRYMEYFRFKGWFMTGDMALIDEEGYFYHQGRTDDLIKVGEKLIGPYEIEHILYQHPAVREAAIIAKSSKPSNPILKAFIVINKYFMPSNRLNQEIKAFVKANLSPDIPLNEITFLDKLPRTSSGKLLRRILRVREMGLPGGNPFGMQD